MNVKKTLSLFYENKTTYKFEAFKLDNNQILLNQRRSQLIYKTQR